MNILFVTTHLNAGGITSYLLTLSKGMVSRGHRVVIASSGGDTQQVFKKSGVICLPLDIKTKSGLSPKVFAAIQPLQKIVLENRIDVVHAQTRVTQVLATFLKQRHPIPYVSTCHGFFKRRLLRRLFGCWGDQVIAISQPVAEHLKKDFGVADQRIALIQSGIPLDDFCMPDEQTRRQYRREFGCEDNDCTVGLVARLSDVKGQDILIESFVDVCLSVRHAKLLLFGEGKFKGHLLDLIDRHRLQGKVQIHSIVNRTADCLSALDIAVFPSRSEGLGLSIMEAQAMGLPVVASAVGGIPALIEEGQTGLLVEKENKKALTEAIIRLANDSALAKQLGQLARRHVEATASSGTMVEKTLEVYQSIKA